jgi:AcrR family transcriptional regulator
MSPARSAGKPVTAAGRARPLRADARRNIDAIVDAAITCLARDPDASLGEIAALAGVGRVTLYGHFDSRAALITAVMERAIRETEEVQQTVDLTGDPAAALARLIEATWPNTHRYGALVVAAEHTLDPDDVVSAHSGPMERVRQLLDRGRAEGRFRSDPPLDWLVNLLHTMTHTIAAAVYRGEVTEADGPRLIVATMLGTLTPPGETVPVVRDEPA